MSGVRMSLHQCVQLIFCRCVNVIWTCVRASPRICSLALILCHSMCWCAHMFPSARARCFAAVYLYAHPQHVLVCACVYISACKVFCSLCTCVHIQGVKPCALHVCQCICICIGLLWSKACMCSSPPLANCLPAYLQLHDSAKYSTPVMLRCIFLHVCACANLSFCNSPR